jgi:hypothetical protein
VAPFPFDDGEWSRLNGREQSGLILGESRRGANRSIAVWNLICMNTTEAGNEH